MRERKLKSKLRISFLAPAAIVVCLVFFLPEKYHLADIIWQSKSQSAVLGEQNQVVNQNDNNNSASSTGNGNGGAQASQEQKETLAQFFQISGDSLRAGDIIIEKDGDLYVAPNAIAAENIERHAITNGNLQTGSVTSRVIADKSIQSNNLASYIDIRLLQVKDKVKAGTLDLGTNTITDGQMSGDWNFGAGNLTTSGAISASAFSGNFQGIFIPTGDVNMAGHFLTDIGNDGTNFTNTGGLNLAGDFNVNSGNLYVDAVFGNVGIGTTSPSQLLSVGSTNQFTVNTSGNVLGGTYNKVTITAPATGSTLTIADAKTLTVNNTLTLSGTDGSTLNIGTGGTLGSNAFTSTAYAPIASPTFTGIVTIPTPFTLGAVSVTTTGAQLNYLNAATGTTGTNSTNLVFSASPTLTGTLTAATANFSGLVSGTAGLTITGAAVNLNASSNFAINLGTGTSTGAITIGGGSNTVAINSSNWKVSIAGAASGLTGITSSGTINFSGLTASRLVTTDTSKNLVSTITLANLVASISDITGSTGTGNLVLSASPTLTGSVTMPGTGIWNSSGNVGIGTTSPQTMLNIFGQANAFQLSYDSSNYSTLSADSTGELQIKGGSVYDASLTLGSNDANNVALVFNNNDNPNNFYVGVDHDNSGHFEIGLLNQSPFLTVLPASGNVGIGTTNPAHKLEVAGDVSITGNFIQNGTNLVVPDYVFQSDYNLMSLNDLQSYVATNSHLPGVPSESDIKKNGLNTGAMIMDLLQSTEENTLYILGNHNDIQNLAQLVNANQQAETSDVANLQTQLNTETQNVASLQETLNNQTLSVGSKINLIGTTISQITDNQTNDEKNLADFENTLNAETQNVASLQTDIQTLQDQIATLQQQNQTVIDFSTALNLNSLIYKDSSGNLDLGEGKLAASGVTAGILTIKVVDPKAPTIGQAEICSSGQLFDDSSGECADSTDSNADGTSVFVSTTAVTGSSRVFVTAQTLTGQPLAVTEIKSGQGFKVEVQNAVSAPIIFNWWVVQEDGTADSSLTDTTDTAMTVPTCTGFTYSAWGACQADNTKTRTVTASTPDSCTDGSPILSQSCTYAGMGNN